MSGKGNPGESLGPPTHAGMPVLAHVDPDVLKSIGTRMADRQSAAPILAAMGAPVFSNALGDHLRDHKLVAIDECLAGNLPVRTPDIVREIREACIRIPTGIAPTDLALLRHTGLDVPAALALALAMDLAAGGSAHPLELWSSRAGGRTGYGFSLLARRCRDGPRVVSVEGMWLGDGVDWGMSGVIVEGIPRSVMLAAQGRPLRDLVSHPVLDGFRHVAGDIVEVGDDPRTLIPVADPGVHIAIDTLLEVTAVLAPSAFDQPTVEERRRRESDARAGKEGAW